LMATGFSLRWTLTVSGRGWTSQPVRK